MHVYATKIHMQSAQQEKVCKGGTAMQTDAGTDGCHAVDRAYGCHSR